MKRYLCQKCFQPHGKEVDGSRFPKFTILGGILGAFAGIFLGPVILIPVSMIAGVAVYQIACDICGSKDKVFEAVKERIDKNGIKRYIRAPFRLYENQEPLDDQIWIDNIKQEFIFDETEGQFVTTIDSPDTDVEVSFDVGDLDVGFDTGIDAGFDGGDGGGE